MTGRSAPGRYARSLLEVSIKEGDPVRAERELAEFAEFLDRHGEVALVLHNPAIAATRKRSLVSALIERAGFSTVVSKLLLLLAERGRLGLLPDLIVTYRERLRAFQQIVLAEITTAVPLSADRAQAIERSLASLTGKQVTLETRVDPAIVGGVVARIGSTIYDGSVTRQLERMKEKLAAGD